MRAARVSAGALLALMASVMVAASGSAAAAPRSPEVVTNVPVNQAKPLARNLEEPELLADRSNPTTVYLFGLELLSGECRFYTSTDRGYTWTMGTPPSLPPYTKCGPSGRPPLNFRSTLTQGPDGTLYITYAASDPASGGSRNVLFARSTDQGHNWSTVLLDAAPSPPTAAGNVRTDLEPHATVDPNDPKHIFVDWRRSYPFVPGKEVPPTRAFESTSTDGGVTFSTPQMMFDRSIGFDPPYPIFVNRVLYASWQETFPRPTGGGKAPPSKLYLSSSTDGGRTWTDNIIDQGKSSRGDTPLVLYDTTRNRFETVWDDTRNGSADIFFSASADGRSWSAATRLNDDPKGTGRDHLLPAASLAPDGRVDVVWYDYRNDPYPLPLAGDLGHRNDVYSTSSFDGGATWTPNVRVSDLLIDRLKGTWNGQYFIEVPPAVASGRDWAVAVWSDTRRGDANTQTQDLYAAPMAFASSMIPAGFAGAIAPGYSRSDLIIVGVVAGAAGLLGGIGLALLLSVSAARRRRLTSSAE